jgi:hypothetical protein
MLDTAAVLARKSLLVAGSKTLWTPRASKQTRLEAGRMRREGVPLESHAGSGTSDPTNASRRFRTRIASVRCSRSTPQSRELLRSHVARLASPSFPPIPPSGPHADVSPMNRESEQRGGKPASGAEVRAPSKPLQIERSVRVEGGRSPGGSGAFSAGARAEPVRIRPPPHHRESGRRGSRNVLS